MKTIDEALAAHPLPFKLREDQYESCSTLGQHPRAGLYAQVGTGKTVMSTVIALMWDAEVNIVVMPPILLRSWQRWLESVGNIGEILVYREPNPAKRKQLPVKSARWVLMSLQIFKNDFEHLLKQLGSKTRTVIVDEATSVKNPASQSHKLVKSAAEGHNLALLTGTPLSTPHDAYAYVRLISPEIYRSKGQYDNLHVDEVDFFGNVSRWKNLDLMQQNLLQHSVRLLKAEVLKGLEEPNYIPRAYDLDPEHLALYNQLAEEQLLLLEDGSKIDATSASKLFNALQQVVLNWDYFSGNEDARSKTFDLIDEVIDEADVMNPANTKLIVFTYFKRTSRKVLEYLQNWGAVGCYSEISGAKQAHNLDRFLFDPKCRILVAQPVSGGVGFNPQAVCSDVLFVESPTVPWHFVQAVGRVYRDGQRWRPNVSIGLAEGTIQRRLHQRLLAQDALVNQVQLEYKDLKDAIYGN